MVVAGAEYEVKGRAPPIITYCMLPAGEWTGGVVGNDGINNIIRVLISPIITNY